MSEDLRLASVRDLAEAFDRHDIAGSMYLLSASARCHRGDGGAGLGRDESADLLRAVLRAFPDARLMDVRAAIIGDKAIAEWTFEGTHRGAWTRAGRTLEATGRSVRFSGALLLGFDEAGLIDSVDARVDTAAPLAQIAMAAPATGGEDVGSFATRYTAAWCSQDPSRVAEFFHPEKGALSVNGGAPAVGHEAITAIADGFMTTFPDLIVAMDDLHVSGDRAVYCWTLKGTDGGPSGSGNRVQISGYEVWRFGPDGRIAESRGYFDSGAYSRQLIRSPA